MSMAFALKSDGTDDEEFLFERIAGDLHAQGWSVVPSALPIDISFAIFSQLQTSTDDAFAPAGVGRSVDHVIDPSIRRDEISWIEGITQAERDWLQWSDRLRIYLNRRLFLGLFSFESHFAHYRPGAFYRKHVDAFRNQPFKDGTNRVLSVVAYFNPDWLPEHGGELVMYDESGERSIQSVAPEFGTLVVFLSEEVPHEVKPARRDRFSIAGWYRVNNSINQQIDPPR